MQWSIILYQAHGVPEVTALRALIDGQIVEVETEHANDIVGSGGPVAAMATLIIDCSPIAVAPSRQENGTVLF